MRSLFRGDSNERPHTGSKAMPSFVLVKEKQHLLSLVL